MAPVLLLVLSLVLTGAVEPAGNPPVDNDHCLQSGPLQTMWFAVM